MTNKKINHAQALPSGAEIAQTPLAAPSARRRYLFIHQNFPAQFIHVAATLAAQGHDVVALGVTGRGLPGVRYRKYQVDKPKQVSGLGVLHQLEGHLAYGLSCAAQMKILSEEGFEPDVVVAHPGWGEAFFVHDIWPRARMVVFHEYFYRVTGGDVNFDPEFAKVDSSGGMRLRIRNTHLLHGLHSAHQVVTPTHWQYSLLPQEYKYKAHVVFDGIPTDVVRPHAQSFIQLQRDQRRLTREDEVLTFVNRNLEPMRGFHVFMRALPEIMRRRPNVRVVIVGGDDVSYGAKPQSGLTWRETMLNEVGDALPLARVHFVGRVPYSNYLSLLQLSTCHVYLTYPFVLSWSCLEAMAAGAVVVGSRTAPVQEVIRHGENGLLVDFFDTQALADQVCAVLENRQAYAHLGVQARADVVANYDLKRVCLPRMLRLLDGEAV